MAMVRSRCLTLRFSTATPEQFQGAMAPEQAPTQNLNLQLCLENFLFRLHQTMHRDAA